MKLLGIEFGRVLNASGARNFFGDGYWFHRPLRPLGLDWSGAPFVAKTTTLLPRAGNMPLDGTTPREWRPRCIRINWRAGAVLNAVGLSGPGLTTLLGDGRWQARTRPFLLSFMAVEPDRDARIAEAETFGRRLAIARRFFRARFGVQVNLSCPNVGVDPSSLIGESRAVLSAVSAHLPGVPLLPKLNALVPVPAAREMATHPNCAALVVSNTIPWGRLPDRIDWRGLFGEVSPLAEFGGGGLSGAPLLPIVWDWLDEARRHPGGFPVPIVGGGGVLSAEDAGYLSSAGAAAIELGAVAILRPWRVRKTVRSLQPRSTDEGLYSQAG
jgi:dihydroorotate dehydrogenase (NAD+) catalytic subunit